LEQILSNSSPPDAYSITIARCVRVKRSCRRLQNRVVHPCTVKQRASRNNTMLWCRSALWQTISRATFSSIFCAASAEQGAESRCWQPSRTLPLVMYLMATSAPVASCRSNLAWPKLPSPSSFTCCWSSEKRQSQRQALETRQLVACWALNVCHEAREAAIRAARYATVRGAEATKLSTSGPATDQRASSVRRQSDSLDSIGLQCFSRFQPVIQRFNHNSGCWLIGGISFTKTYSHQEGPV